MSNNSYVHGYTERESQRLVEQSEALTDLLHAGTRYPTGALVLEAGCGVGAQTLTLATRSPHARFISVDISAASLKQARTRIRRSRYTNVVFQQADINRLPFPEHCFDHIFVCFVLEHLAQPVDSLVRLNGLLKPGGSLTVIEGDHGSTFFHPSSETALRTVQCLVALQAETDGDALIGRRLYPLLKAAGFSNVRVVPRMVYVDASRPDLIQGFTRNTFIAMVNSVRRKALEQGMMEEAEWQQGIADLERTTAPDGVFCYTFFKGVAIGYSARPGKKMLRDDAGVPATFGSIPIKRL